jgi:AcrR family transcriptional regulator
LRRPASELFIAKGYEETTLDDIASAAGKSKDEILLAWQSGLTDSIRTSILEAA